MAHETAERRCDDVKIEDMMAYQICILRLTTKIIFDMA
jgi:hypothetical protein